MPKQTLENELQKLNAQKQILSREKTGLDGIYTFENNLIFYLDKIEDLVHNVKYLTFQKEKAAKRLIEHENESTYFIIMSNTIIYS